MLRLVIQQNGRGWINSVNAGVTSFGGYDLESLILKRYGYSTLELLKFTPCISIESSPHV